MIIKTPPDIMPLLKSRDLVTLQCVVCQSDFYKMKKWVLQAQKYGKDTLEFCSRECFGKSQSNQKPVICDTCSAPILRKASDVRDRNFCSRSCWAKFKNKHKSSGFRRSKAEVYLEELIHSSFPQLVLLSNTRDVLPSGLELDFYMPEIKLAIEMNGPVHYLPIYGSDIFDRTKNNDHVKLSEAVALGIGLMIVDISQQKYWKTSQRFIYDTFNCSILPIIQSLIHE